MEYLVVILIIIILYILIKSLQVKEKFVRSLLAPDVLEVVKSGSEAKIVFQRNKEHKIRLGDTDPNEKYEYLIFYVNADKPNQGIWIQRKVLCNSEKCEFILKNLSGDRYHMAIVETKDERISSVKKIIAEHLGIDDMDKITNDAKFIDDLGADSLDTVELVMAFEEAFNVEIPDEKAETILTVGDAISHLENN